MQFRERFRRSIKSLRFKLKRFLVEISSSKISTHNLAFGFALGTFIAILPTPGFGILLGILLIYFFKKINATSILFPFAVWNPLLLAPLYILSYKIGDLLFHAKTTVEAEYAYLSKILYFCQTYLVGNVIVAVVFSLLSYFIVFHFTELFKLRKLQKRKALATLRNPL
ncbi:hypothetical protein BH23BAC1_BH23BAC1_35410 [soil metagenome]